MICLALSNLRCLMPNVSRHLIEQMKSRECGHRLPFNVQSLFSASSKTISGLLEFDSKTEAVEVLTVLNHYQIRIPSKSMRKTSITAYSVSLMLETSQIIPECGAGKYI